MSDKYSLLHLEFNLSHGCNLSCKSCDHQSSLFSAKSDFPDYKKFEESIDILSKYLVVERFQLQGGEPLLNKNILSYIQHAKKSSLAKQLSLITNGTLLHLITEDICNSLDEIIVSKYPQVKLDTKEYERIKLLCKKSNTEFKVNSINRFQYAVVSQKINPLIASIIHKTCNIAYQKKYYALYDGFLSRCSRMPLILKRHGINDLEKDLLKIEDGLEFVTKFKNYFKKSKNQPQACQYCLSTLGKWHQHQMKDENSDVMARGLSNLSIYQILKKFLRIRQCR